MKPDMEAFLSFGMARATDRSAMKRRGCNNCARNSTMGKRALGILLCIIMAFSCLSTACQPTPEEPIVANKDVARMAEQAETTGGEEILSLVQQLETPKTWRYTGSNAKGNLTIEIDADIVVPDAHPIPIVRVESADFMQETVQQFFDFLCGGHEMYDQTQRRTKGEIEQGIILNKKLRNSEDYADDPDGQAMIDGWTAALEREYATAPEDKEVVPVDGTLYVIPLIDPMENTVGDYIGINAANAGQDIHFIVENNNDLTEPIIYEYGSGWSGLLVYRGANLRFSDNSNPFDAGGMWYSEPSIPIVDETIVPFEAYGRLRITPAKARAELEKLLKGTNMDISAIYLVSDYCSWNENPASSKKTANYGYEFLCTRRVNGVPCAITAEATNVGDRYAPSWAYEMFNVLITDDGIIELYWNSPHTVTETVVQRTELLPFSQISSIIEKMLAVNYPKENPYTSFVSTTVRINRIELALQRVSEPNNIDAGLLVPVWSCYGSIRQAHASGRHSDSAEIGRTYPECLLTVNAVDGSVIDLNKGY